MPTPFETVAAYLERELQIADINALTLERLVAAYVRLPAAYRQVLDSVLESLQTRALQGSAASAPAAPTRDDRDRSDRRDRLRSMSSQRHSGDGDDRDPDPRAGDN